MISVQNTLYFFNGNTRPGPAADKTCCSAPVTAVRQYSVSSRVWSNVVYSGWKPVARYGHSFSEINGILWLFGGASSHRPFCFNDMWKYSIATGQWSPIIIKSKDENTPPVIPPPRSFHSWATGVATPLSSPRRFSIVFGGTDCSLANIGDLWKFDHNTQEWSEIVAESAGPGARARAATSIYQSDETVNLILYGGDKKESALDDMWLFDFSSLSWTQLSDFNSEPMSKRGKFSFISQLNKLFVFGGSSQGRVLSDVWIFDYMTKSWKEVQWISKKGSLIHPERYGHFTVPVDGNSFISCAGTNGLSPFDDCVLFDSLTKEWVKLTLPASAPSIDPRFDTNPAYYCGSTYVYGGRTTVLVYDDLWMMSTGQVLL
eukprot:c20891_g1_i2.p1 GENE.c20891_g1_i2~~c20891_g1_i2.p1  ORF type:complete len:374 (-),score=181.80 c20891_g1_i2:71-1192(-)